jgi:hypothetical protein
LRKIETGRLGRPDRAAGKGKGMTGRHRTGRQERQAGKAGSTGRQERQAGMAGRSVRQNRQAGQAGRQDMLPWQAGFACADVKGTDRTNGGRQAEQSWNL